MKKFNNRLLKLIQATLVLGVVYQSIPSASASEACKLTNGSALQSRALSFMKSSRLIQAGDETEYFKWGLRGTVDHANGCVVVMQLGYKLEDGTLDFSDNTTGFEVVVLQKKTNRFFKFEELIKIPASVRAELGSCSFKGFNPKGSCKTVDNNIYPVQFRPYTNSYFVTIKDRPSIIALMKSHVGKFSFNGFNGVVKKGPRSSLDPVLARKWAVKSATYSIRLAMSVEGNDVNPADLDGLKDILNDGNQTGILEDGPRTFIYSQSDFDTIWNTCFKPKGEPADECTVNPWAGGSLVRFL